MLVLTQMLGQLVDAGGQDRDLDLREPVSPSWVAYSAMIAVFFSFWIMGILHLSKYYPTAKSGRAECSFRSGLPELSAWMYRQNYQP